MSPRLRTSIHRQAHVEGLPVDLSTNRETRNRGNRTHRRRFAVDEIGTTQQYYIAAGSSPSDDRARVLKYGRCFAVFNRYGDIEPLGLGEHGIFYLGCRHLSEFVLALWNARPLLLSSTVKSDNFAFVADLANVDVGDNQIVVPRGK